MIINIKESVMEHFCLLSQDIWEGETILIQLAKAYTLR